MKKTIILVILLIALIAISAKWLKYTLSRQRKESYYNRYTRKSKNKFEWVCSDYDGNTLFSDDEITAWTELPEPEQEGKNERGCK